MPDIDPPPNLPDLGAGSGTAIAVALRAAEPRVHLLAASVLIRAGALEAAWEPLTRVAEAVDDPEIRGALAEELLLLAKKWQTSGQPGQAEQPLRLAAGLVPSRAASALARHLQRRGAVDEAMALWDDVLRLNPGSAEHYLDYGSLLESQGRFQEAYHTYVRLLHSSPTVGNALMVAARLDRFTAMLPSSPPARAVRIALLGSVALEPLRGCLVAQAHRAGLQPEVRAVAVDLSWHDVLDRGRSLHGFAPQLVILAFHRTDLFPELGENPLRLSATERGRAIDAGLGRVRSLLSTVGEGSGALVLLHNVVVPQRPLLGVLDAQEDERALFRQVNASLAHLVHAEFENVRLVDENGVQAWCGQADATDPRYWLAARMPWSATMLMQLAREHVRHLCAHLGLVRRCLVLDPDNGLWGGTLGPSGIAGIRLGRRAPDNAYRFFQRELLDLHVRGVQLAICSGNSHLDLPAVLDGHPDMLLRSTHLAASRVNPRPASDNVADLAAELGLPLDAVVFWDAEPAERARMRSALPQVLTPEVPRDPARYRQALIDLPVFETLAPGVRS